MRTAPLSAVLAVLLGAAAQDTSAQSLLHAAYGSQPLVGMASALDGAGDVNGDGLPDYIVSATLMKDPGGVLTGAAEVRSGSDGSVLHTFYGTAAGQSFGSAVAGAGDVDADGRGDLIVGTPFGNVNGTRSGLARVFSGIDGALLHEYHGATPFTELGTRVAGAGDVNADGYADFAITLARQGMNGEVRVHSGLDGSLLLTLVGDGGNEGFGMALDGAGDVNADGHADIIAGMTGTNRARVYSGLDGTTLYTFNQPYAQSWVWGHAVAGAGDVNADGHADLIVGDRQDSKLFAFGGMARVFSGADGSELFSMYGMLNNHYLGTDVDGAGDVDGDGYDDVVSGSPGYGTDTLQGGQLVVYSGRTGTLLRAFVPEAVESGDDLGRTVAGLGDVNGDGFDDVAGGCSDHSTALPLAGMVVVCSLRFVAYEVDPAEVVFNHQAPLSIFGAGFEPDSPITVTVGGTPATDVTWVSPQRVDCLTPGDGVQDTVVDVVVEQAGQSVPLHAALKLGGTKIFGVWPPNGPYIGGDEVVIYGDNFVDDGSTVVTVGGTVSTYQATILEIDEPNVMVIETPVMPIGAGPGIKIVSSAGTAFTSAYKFDEKWIYPHTGNITGGEVITMYGDLSVAPNMTATVGGIPAQILSAVPGRIEILTPAVESATGQMLDVRTYSNTSGLGKHSVSGSFLYTPFAAATKSGSAFTGLKLAVSVRSSTPEPQDNLVTLFVIDPLQVPHLPGPKGGASGTAGLGGAGASVSGGAGAGVGASPATARAPSTPVPSGKLHGVPISILAANVPVPILATAFKLNLGQVSPFLIGTTVHIQGLVTGEGSHGSYTNAMSYVIQ
jgi:hypothetical protein